MQKGKCKSFQRLQELRPLGQCSKATACKAVVPSASLGEVSKKKLTLSFFCEKMVSEHWSSWSGRLPVTEEITGSSPVCSASISMGEWLNPYLNEIIGQYCLSSDWKPQVRILLLIRLLWTNGVMVSTRGLYSRLVKSSS